MFFVLVKNKKQSRAVSRKPFILECREEHYTCVQIHVHVLPRGITTETYLTVHVDKNTLHLPFKIKAKVGNRLDLGNTRTQSKTKINLKLNIAVKGQIHMNLSKLK